MERQNPKERNNGMSVTERRKAILTLITNEPGLMATEIATKLKLDVSLVRAD